MVLDSEFSCTPVGQGNVVGTSGSLSSLSLSPPLREADHPRPCPQGCWEYLRAPVKARSSSGARPALPNGPVAELSSLAVLILQVGWLGFSRSRAVPPVLPLTPPGASSRGGPPWNGRGWLIGDPEWRVLAPGRRRCLPQPRPSPQGISAAARVARLAPAPTRSASPFTSGERAGHQTWLPVSRTGRAYRDLGKTPRGPTSSGDQVPGRPCRLLREEGQGSRGSLLSVSGSLARGWRLRGDWGAPWPPAVVGSPWAGPPPSPPCSGLPRRLHRPLLAPSRVHTR